MRALDSKHHSSSARALVPPPDMWVDKGKWKRRETEGKGIEVTGGV